MIFEKVHTYISIPHKITKIGEKIIFEVISVTTESYDEQIK